MGCFIINGNTIIRRQIVVQALIYFNQRMIKLESVFLANIILYIDSIETCYKFSMVNKKCLEAMKFLKINPCFTRNFYKNQTTQEVITNSIDKIKLMKEIIKEVELFPNIETYEFGPGTFSIGLMKVLPKTIENIIIDKITLNTPLCLTKEDKAKIISMNIIIQEPINLSEYPNLRKITIEVDENAIEKCFTNSKQHFEFVRIKLTENINVPFLKELISFPIDKIVLVFLCDLEMEKVYNAFPYFIKKNYIAMEYLYDTMPNSIIPLCENCKLEIDQMDAFDTKLIDKILPTNIFFIGKNNNPIDLSKMNYLKRIAFEDNSMFLLPNSIISLQANYIPQQILPNLKDLTLVNAKGEIILPSTLTSLSLRDCHIQIINSNYSNLKSLFTNNYYHSIIPSLTSLTSLKIGHTSINHSFNSLIHLKELIFEDVNINWNIESFYPSSLTYLHCHGKQLPSYLSLTHLLLEKPLQRDLNKLENYTQLIYLFVSELPSHSIILPQSLRYFTLNKTNTKNLILSLNQFTNLLTISIINCIDVHFTLPLNLIKLDILYTNNIEITNLKSLSSLKELCLVDEQGINLDEIPLSLHWIYYDISDPDLLDCDENDDPIPLNYHPLNRFKTSIKFH
ncbi:hypothetical protein EDI_196630 [Entamoeba dispar SAW760]|uniref:Uncharacterized protein n=1 Tax=Entamoeba dispar (strain ATCC PRA-260 / SAW760) TaxID=370354 RepID=B0EQS4_ENTDS|nr:uncharacterized protein EDI_196630 [Entamoeba dispar SAW760]EDR23120.1 hypothetical protein EDI_196630 [Entamoeba dispar SAW760]|eukprot:EDR23120.1 hypothetical protein EDI_196630 [Entamoeba dispar SAW760]